MCSSDLLENRIEDHQQWGYNSIYNQRKGAWFWSAGIQAYFQKTQRYKILEDLLGASYWLDYDQFAPEQGVSSEVQQNNIEMPDHKILTGNRFGYHYTLLTQRQEAWAQLEWTGQRIESFAAVSLNHQTIQRDDTHPLIVYSLYRSIDH